MFASLLVSQNRFDWLISVLHPGRSLAERGRNADEVLTPTQAASIASKLDSRVSSAPSVDQECATAKEHQAGALIINADDWGRDANNTDRISECVARGTVSSVSAMVFMEDSERGAAIARERGIDAGLHLNFTTPFSAPKCSPRLAEHVHKLAMHLRSHRFGRILYHPGLARSFEYAVAAQIEEFQRLYGQVPDRLDGHHHMHLNANVLLGKLLPAGTIVRRNETFLASEKGLLNRLYRKSLDGLLVRRHRIVDFFFTLAPIQPVSRLQRIFSLSRDSVIELETHPVDPDEFRLLMSEEIFTQIGSLQIARRFALAQVRPVA